MEDYYKDGEYILNATQELTFSVQKFLTYCTHIASELEYGKDFTEEGHRGLGYVSIIESHFSIDINKENKKNRENIDRVIFILSKMLLSDFFDENINLFSHVYRLYRRIIKFSDTIWENETIEIREKGSQLLLGNTVLLEGPQYKIIGEVKEKMNTTLESFRLFFILLKNLSKNPYCIYVGGNKKYIQLEFQPYIDAFDNILDWCKDNELLSLHENEKHENFTATPYEGSSEEDIGVWYADIYSMPYERAILFVGIYLLKKGEFDILPGRFEIQTFLLELSKKIDPEREKEIISYPFLISKNIEKESVSIIQILQKQSYKSVKEDSIMIDDFLNLLGREGILTQSELVDAISSQDIEESMYYIIQTKLIEKGYIKDPKTQKLFQELYNTFTEKKDAEGETIAYEEDSDFIEDPLLLHLSTGVNILQYLPDLGGELYDYDAYELIFLATERDILNPEIAQDLIDSLEKDIGNKATVIFEIFEYIFNSGFFDEIKISEDERIELKKHYFDVRYALNMLYNNPTSP